MNDYMKIQASPVLVLAAQLGFTVRGFSSVSTGRAGGLVSAILITKDGATVSELRVHTSGMSGLEVSWMDADGERHQDEYTIQLRDDGVIRASPKTEAPEVTVPEKPAWQ